MGKVKEYWANNEKKWELMEIEYYLSHLKSHKRQRGKCGKVDK